MKLGWMVLLVGVQGLALSVSMSVSAERKDPYTGKIEKEKKVLEKLRGTIVEKRKKSDEAEKKRESILFSRDCNPWMSGWCSTARSTRRFGSNFERKIRKSSR